MVLVARWTYAFLLIHNLVTFAQYAIFIITRLDFYPSHLSILTIIHSAFHEVVFFTIVLCVPISYLIGFAAQSCCGISRGADMEMDKVDKIYTDVWTTPSVRNGNSSSRPGSATPSNTTMTNFNSSSNPAGNGLVTGKINWQRNNAYTIVFSNDRLTKWSCRETKSRRWIQQYPEFNRQLRRPSESRNKSWRSKHES